MITEFKMDNFPVDYYPKNVNFTPNKKNMKNF